MQYIIKKVYGTVTSQILSSIGHKYGDIPNYGSNAVLNGVKKPVESGIDTVFKPDKSFFDNNQSKKSNYFHFDLKE